MTRMSFEYSNDPKACGEECVFNKSLIPEKFRFDPCEKMMLYPLLAKISVRHVVPGRNFSMGLKVPFMLGQEPLKGRSMNRNQEIYFNPTASPEDLYMQVDNFVKAPPSGVTYPKGSAKA